MSEGAPPGSSPDPVERDDQLLDAISRGDPPPVDHPADDPLAALLIRWHADVVARSHQLESRLEASGTTAPVRAIPPSHSTVDAAPGEPAQARSGGAGHTPAVAAVKPAVGRRHRRPKVLAGATLALVTVVGTVWLGAARAEPGELLWPVTRLVHADRAEALRTEREIGRLLDQARQELADGQHAHARYHLERATALLNGIGDDETLTRLRDDINELRHLLPPPDPTNPPAPGTSVGASVPAPSDTASATSAVPQPAATVPPSSPRPPIQSTPTPPTAESRPTNLPGRTPPAQPSAPAVNPQPQAPPATASTTGADAPRPTRTSVPSRRSPDPTPR